MQHEYFALRVKSLYQSRLQGLVQAQGIMSPDIPESIVPDTRMTGLAALIFAKYHREP